MPNRVLCPKCHGQRTSVCLACRGTGKRSIAGINIGNCNECDGGGQRRCDVCSGNGEVESDPSTTANEHQPSCFALEEERGEGWRRSGAMKPSIKEAKPTL
jgi:hypothetical protein